MTNIEGLDQLFSKFDSMDDSVVKVLGQAIAVETKTVQGIAKLLAPSNHGPLRDSIKTKLIKDDDKVQGIVFTNLKYAPYVEFGTGPVGQKNHEGISPNVDVSYSQKGWAFPASEVTEEDAKQYKWPSRMYNGEKYYVTSGQPAQPFMYPALKNYESTAVKNITKKMNKLLEGYRKND